MIGTVRKHQTWLWLIIIAAVVVSFVIYFTPGVTLDRSRLARAQYGFMNGKPIPPKAMREAFIEAQIRVFLRSGRWPDRAEARRMEMDLDRQARERLVLADRMERLGIVVSDADLARWIEENFANPSQPGSARAMYETLVRELARHGVTEADLARFIRHEIGIAHLLDLTGVAGALVTPREAEAQYRRQNERFHAEAAVFTYSNYLAAVQVNPDELARFYTNRRDFYRQPERVQVQFVRFALTNYLAQAEEELAKRTNLTAELDALYRQAGPNRFTDENGQVLPPEAAKVKIREQLRDDQARLAARREAAKFATELDKMEPRKPENLAALAAQKGIPVTTTAPFSEAEGPRGLEVPPQFARMAFSLSPERPFSATLVGQDGVYLLAFRARFPSEIPPLEALRDRVEEEYRREQALILARQACTNFVANLTNQLAAGRNFTDLAVQAGATWIGLPVFTLASRNLPQWDPRVSLDQVKLVAPGLQPNTPSGPVLTRDGALVLLLKKREPVTDAELREALPNYLSELRAQRRFNGFSDWFQRQIELTRITMPSESEHTP
jgi:hypothetical protein